MRKITNNLSSKYFAALVLVFFHGLVWFEFFESSRIFSLYSALVAITIGWLLVSMIGNSKLSIYLTISVFSLVLLEVLLFVFSPHLSYEERNGSWFYQLSTEQSKLPEPYSKNDTFYSKNEEFSIAHLTNDFGYRDENIEGDSISVIYIGDSFIEGVGVEQEAAPDKLLENRIGCDGCVLNMGLAGSDLFCSYPFLLSALETINPKVVVLNINCTDIGDVYMHSEKYGIEHLPKPSLAFQMSFGSSFFLRHLVLDMFDYNWMLLRNKDINEYYNISSHAIIVQLQKYQRLSEEKRFELIICVQSLYAKISGEKDELRTVAELLKYSKVKFVDLYEGNYDGISATDINWPIDMHFNERGYRLFVGTFYEQAESKYPGVLPKRSK